MTNIQTKCQSCDFRLYHNLEGPKSSAQINKNPSIEPTRRQNKASSVSMDKKESRNNMEMNDMDISISQCDDISIRNDSKALPENACQHMNLSASMKSTWNSRPDWSTSTNTHLSGRSRVRHARAHKKKMALLEEVPRTPKMVKVPKVTNPEERNQMNGSPVDMNEIEHATLHRMKTSVGGVPKDEAELHARDLSHLQNTECCPYRIWNSCNHVLHSYIETEYIAHPSRRIAQGPIGSIGKPSAPSHDNDIWVEIQVFYRRKRKRKGDTKTRSMFYALHQKIAYWDEPPSGASQIIFESGFNLE